MSLQDRSPPGTPSQVIVTQPGFFLKREKHLEDDNWITKPLRVPIGTPVGLEVLCMVDRLQITRTSKGAICGGELNYKISGIHGKQAFIGVEDPNCCCAFWCGPSRSYTVHLNNKWEREMLTFLRPYRCDGECTLCCCCPCSLMRIDVIAAQEGRKIGSVKQRLSCFKNIFEASTKDKKQKYRILGKALPCRCCMNLSFKIETAGGNEVGEIWKKRFRGDPKRNTDHETFGVIFPAEASAEMKAVLLAAAFLVNHTYFEMS